MAKGRLNLDSGGSSLRVSWEQGEGGCYRKVAPWEQKVGVLMFYDSTSYEFIYGTIYCLELVYQGPFLGLGGWQEED